MEEETLPGIDPAAMAAACAVAPDPLTAAILAKHAAGTTLTPQECGKLGAYKRKASGAPVGRPRKDGSPAQPSHAAPAAAAAAPDAYAGLDSTGVAMASAGEDLAKRHGHISGRARGGFPDRAPPSDRLDR